MHAVARTYNERPFLLFWEVTKACPLACAHCRAHAQCGPAAGELSHEEAIKLLDDIARFGRPSPILVITGGDPLQRPDLFELLEYAQKIGVKTALAPAVSASLNDLTQARLRKAGIHAVSISLDGACAETHEGIRNVKDHFAATLAAARSLLAHGFMVQVNTTVMRRNVEELAEVAALLRTMGVHVWEVFFLVQVGRGTDVSALSALECEDVAHFLYDSASHGFVVRTVEAPFFRRVMNARAALPKDTDAGATFQLGPLYRRLSSRLHSLLGAPLQAAKATSAGTRDGNGILFIAHDGDITPAGFLPLSLGNVRQLDIVEVYRSHPLLQAIRDAAFHGRCGVCEHAQLCGGSRSRAYAASGDPLGEDPACFYTLTERKEPRALPIVRGPL